MSAILTDILHEVYAALTPSDSQSDWATESAAAEQTENYDIKSLKCLPRSSNVSVLIKEGVFFYWKKSAFFENKGAFLA